ncbi:DMT family transporter [Chakrabartyella piscis]|uniref:DMT family transporter n=1 Tax=Chakrabartyella piscis TaxID=2918914 RepID=UPI002958AFAE|nr:DMT family transporter [Chakrabartyella piscis]
MIYFVILAIAGLLQGMMVSFNGQLSTYYSLFTVCFFVHFIAAVLLLIYVKAQGKDDFDFRGAPKYVYIVGIMGLIIVTTSSWCTVAVGATAMLSLSVVGQLISSAIIDHNGWFGLKQKKFQLKQLPSYMLVIAGVLLVVCF